MKIQAVSILEVELIAFELAGKLMEWNEPIPEFGTRYPGRLESCLNTPFQTFGKRVLYKGLLEKASILFYLMIKNHPFQNGNKRIAITTLLYFLHENGKWLSLSNEAMYEFADGLAGSDPRDRQSIVENVITFLRAHTHSY